MNTQRTVATPPATLVGLGPPEPPTDDGADAPAETLRPWSTSADGSADASGVADMPFFPLSAPFPPDISPPFLRSPVGASAPRASVPHPALFIAATLIAAGAAASIGWSIARRSPPQRGQIAASCPLPTTGVVENTPAAPPKQDRTAERFPEAFVGEPSAPSKKPRIRPHRSPVATISSAGASGAIDWSGSADETAKSSVAPDHAPLGAKSSVVPDQSRIQTIAETVRLEDDATRSVDIQ